MAAVEHRVDRDAGGNAEHALHEVAGNGRRRGQTLAEPQARIAEVAEDHDDLRRRAADELRRQLAAALPHGLKNIRRGDRHRELDDERAGGIVRIAQQVGEHRAEARRRAAVPRPQHPRREQHGAVAEVDVALHGRGHLDDHRHHGAEGGEQRREDQLTQFHIRHENHLQKSLAFLLGLYFNQNWT